MLVFGLSQTLTKSILGGYLRDMKFITIKLKTFRLITTLTLIVLLLCLFTMSIKAEALYLGYGNRKVPIYSVDTAGEKVVALTFDAAWGADKTSDIIKILKENEVGGTFFLVEFWSENYKDKIKEIDAAGLDIGTHSATHPKMSTLTKSQIISELSSSSEIITSVTGKPVSYFRPPFGDYNNLLLETAEELGLKTIQWSVDSLDWKGLSASQILARIKAGVQNGAIILFHNNADNIVEALPMVISFLKSQGYKMVALSDLVLQNNYTIDSNGVQKRTSG